MADLAPIGDPGVCDTHDHGVTPQRLPALQAEAHAFNHVLLVSEDGHKGPAHRAEVEKANEDFYAFLPGGHDLKGGSFEASKAFYEQVTQLPIGERKKLLELTKSENEELHLHNPSLPQMVLDMDSSAFINSLEFQLVLTRIALLTWAACVQRSLILMQTIHQAEVDGRLLCPL